MDEEQGANFYYLNRDGCWPSFQQVGLDLRLDGAWQLAAVPLLVDDLPAEVAGLPTPTGPAGLAVGPDGTIYYSQPRAHRLLQIDGCDATRRPLPCLGGEGSRPTQLRQPRGLLYHTIRQSLFVADSGNHRVQILDPQTFQLLDIWGQPDLAGEPEPGDAPGRFNEPWSLAQDAEGNVYVVDHGNSRVQKFDLRGQVQPEFEANSKAHLNEPAAVAVAVAGQGEEERVYVLDTDRKQIIVLDVDGHCQGESETHDLQAPMGLAVTDGAVYVGDNHHRRLVKFRLDETFTFVGAAHGYEGPVAALAADHQGGLWLHPGGVLAPLRLALGKAHIQSGVLWGGPFGSGDRPVMWHRLKAIAAPLASGAHIRFFVHTSDDQTQSPAPPAAAATRPFHHPEWQPMPPDVLDGLVSNTLARYLWIGAHFTGEGVQSPILEQFRIDFDHATYRQRLPAIYSKDPVQRALLDRLLSLFESFFADVEQTIAHLSHLFDPQAVPVEWLPWLASWLAFDLDENWSEAQQREAVAKALAMYAKRGTAEGLKEALHFFAGVDAHIEEPILHAGWWSLPTDEDSPPLEAQNSVLGFTTMLASAEAQGAVVGTTAVLDQSHLITQEEFGAPLFEAVAHQFSVQVYQGQVKGTKKLDEISSIIEREKPAHTTYHLCIIEPRMRVGFQARLGIDTIVAGPTPAARLGKTPRSSLDLVTGGEPPGRIGHRSQIGITTRLTGSG
jgi:phage tail-like protein